MSASESGEFSCLFVNLRIVFHGAGAKRIEASVHGVVHLGEVHVVAHEVYFADLRQGEVVSQQLLR